MRAARVPWRIGAVFSKELRVSSRRRRSFALRFAYLALLTLFVALVWLSEVRFEGDARAASRVMRMSEAGKQIIAAIVWFQFVAAQLVAVILLSTSVSEEVYRGTMGPLLTTPLTSLQIVLGKLLGGLLQLLVLLGISLPLLAVVRVFGGVELGYVLGGVCITLTAAIFVGSVTILFSILLRRAHTIILATLGAAAGWNLIVPMVLVMSIMGMFLIDFVNPFFMLFLLTADMKDPASSHWTTALWPVHCLIMLGLSAGVLAFCARTIRRVAMRHETGEPILPPGPPPPVLPALPAAGPAATVAALTRLAQASATSKRAPAPGPAGAPGAARPPPLPSAPPPAAPPPPGAPYAGTTRAEQTAARPVRRIQGSPVFWKELHRPLLPNKTVRTVVTVVAGVLVLMTYAFLAALGALDEPGVQAFYLLLYLIPAAFATMLLSATAVSAEKESRCWPLLLTTTLSDGHILAAKAAGVLRRTLPLWLLLLAHVQVSVMFLRIHPWALVHTALVASAALVFSLAVGLYLSVRLRRTTSAMVVALAVLVGLWGILPMLLALGRQVVVEQWDPDYGWSGGPEHSLMQRMDAAIVSGPIVQSVVIADAATGERPGRRPLRYHWHAWEASLGEFTRALALWAGLHLAAGGLLLWRAKVRFRKSVF